MKIPIPMPVLSDTMTAGRLSEWNKKPGDPVRRGEALATMESDKAVMDVEAFSDGFLSGPLTKPGIEVPVGATIGYLCTTREECDLSGAEGENPAPGPPPIVQAVASPDHPALASPVVLQSSGSSGTAPVSQTLRNPASPYARGLASDLGIGLDSLAPGKDGLIHARQVIDAVLEQPDPDLSMSPPGRLRVPTAMESAVARNMSASRQTPVFHLSSLLSLKSLSDAAKTREISLTLALTRACALAIVQNPRFNCLWTSQGIVQRDRIDIGVAVDLGDGLVTPVLRDVAGRPLDELLEDWRILKEKASLGRLVPTDYAGGTFYLSNLGTFPEVFSFDAILPSTSSAILAVASQAGDGKCTLTLTCDHRILYGGHAARFMNTLAHLLGSPEEWIGIPS